MTTMVCDSTTLSATRFAGMVDHTFLRPYGTPLDIEQLCSEARTWNFAAVAVNPAEIETCARLLQGSTVKIATGIGFPLGQNTVEAKLFETADALYRGANEIDLLVNLRMLRAEQPGMVRREIAGVVTLCRRSGALLKVIVEACYLEDVEKRLLCQMAKEEGADFVKTSTGFGPGGATVADVRLMRDVVGDSMGVKASGGIRTLDEALAMLAAGATRIGTSQSVPLMLEFKKRFPDGVAVG